MHVDDSWPDVQSVASWPSLAHDERPDVRLTALARSDRRDRPLQPSFEELHQLMAQANDFRGGGGPPRLATTMGRGRSRGLGARAAHTPLAATVYLFIGCAFTAAFALTMWWHPLYRPRLDALAWCQAWLLLSVADGWGVCLCLCGIIVASEPPGQALLWVCGCCLLRTPCCCAFLCVRWMRHRTLRLATAAGSGGGCAWAHSGSPGRTTPRGVANQTI